MQCIRNNDGLMMWLVEMGWQCPPLTDSNLTVLVVWLKDNMSLDSQIKWILYFSGVLVLWMRLLLSCSWTFISQVNSYLFLLIFLVL